MVHRADPKTVDTERGERVVLDCAGAKKGGAARFLRELRKYFREARPQNVEVIGAGKKLTPQWLIQRELLAASAKSRIALNNASFFHPQNQNITLLRNILHFATTDDLEELGFRPTRRLRAQTPVIRALARASEMLVVPCTAMAEQVARVSPELEDRLAVRFHPVSRPVWAGQVPTKPYDVLLPVVPSPYKNLDQHIPEFLEASENLTESPVRLIIPSTPEWIPSLASHPRIKFIGYQTSEELEQWWRDAAAVFFPTKFEAFGYPLAEGRVYGRSVIAQETSQNREIAGAALKPYERGIKGSLKGAIYDAMTHVPKPDPAPFDPITYFEWLL